MHFFDSHTILSIVYALLSAVLPAMVWLFFWTREDRANPEPKIMILIAFLGGVIAVLISLFFEKIVFNIDPRTIFSYDFLNPVLDFLSKISVQESINLNKVALVLVFAPVIEELSKFIFAYGLVLRSKADDEPIDPLIYMIVTAIGFAAIENMLFLIDPIIKNDLIFGIQTGNMRFIGSTLLHTVSSATIGIFIGLKFFDKKFYKFLWTILAVLLAIVIHSLFNFFMIKSQQSTFVALELIWVAVIIVLLAFEKIKKEKIEKIRDNPYK
jgi:RsiW-degrading membrane proteinase PrsW (M82 family)